MLIAITGLVLGGALMACAAVSRSRANPDVPIRLYRRSPSASPGRLSAVLVLVASFCGAYGAAALSRTVGFVPAYALFLVVLVAPQVFVVVIHDRAVSRRDTA